MALAMFVRVLTQRGNSLVVTIPPEVSSELGWKRGDTVCIILGKTRATLTKHPAKFDLTNHRGARARRQRGSSSRVKRSGFFLIEELRKEQAAGGRPRYTIT